MFCCMPGLIRKRPHILWIEYEENWDDFVRDGFGCIPLLGNSGVGGGGSKSDPHYRQL